MNMDNWRGRLATRPAAQRGLLLLVAPLLALLWLALAAAPLHAAGVVGTGMPGSCTDAAYAAAFTGGGLVTFNCGPSPATIVVNTQVITGPTTVEGGGLVVLDGENLRQMFLVLAGGDLTLRNITLQNGNFGDGGAVFVAQGGTLRLQSVTVRNSEADGANSDGGAVQNRGTLLVENSRFLGNRADGGGGAINNEGGTATVRSSVFIGNTALNGGALGNAAGSLDIRSSLLLSGTADNQGGGLFAAGGAITMTNVMVARNSAARGGGVYGMGNAVVRAFNSTVYSNTASSAAGGVWNNTAGSAANVVLKNTIVAGNNSVGVLNCDGPAMRTLGHNLIGDGACIAPQTGDLQNTEPKLLPLPLAGGALAYAPAAGSPAIDAGDNDGCPTFDLRSYPRPIGGVCDIGAVESGRALWLAHLLK